MIRKILLAKSNQKNILIEAREVNKKEKVEKFFNEDSTDYVKYKYILNQHSFMYIRQKVVIEIIKKYLSQLFSDGIILDAGCGPGLLIDQLSECNAKCIGYDLSEKMLELAKRRNPRNESKGFPMFMRGDIEKMPFHNNSFDLVISLGVIEYLDDDIKILSEFRRILKPNGYLIIAITNKYAYNLVFDNIIEKLKVIKFIGQFMGFLKEKINMGNVKQRAFTIRKHSPIHFKSNLEKCKFAVLTDKYFGLNILPYPFNILMGKLNANVEVFFNKISHTKIGLLGEGYLVLCQSI
jgi:ubiquinone/menaquinone biosynthesis C-methylase UbiE